MKRLTLSLLGKFNPQDIFIALLKYSNKEKIVEIKRNLRKEASKNAGYVAFG